MGIKRIVDTEFWTDDKVVDLFSPEDRYFMLYLLTNPHTTQLGIYKINKRIVAFEMGYSLETVNVLLDRFETKYQMIRYSPDTGEVAIKNYLRYSIIKGGKPVYDLLMKEISTVRNKDLLSYIFAGLQGADNLNETVEEVINKYISNINENENEESYNDSSDDSYNESMPKRFVPPTIEEVKAYCKERNNHVDAERFIDFYESKGWMVGKNKMKNWKACVRTWEQRDKGSKTRLQDRHDYDYDEIEERLFGDE